MPTCQIEIEDPAFPYIRFLSREIKNSDELPAIYKLICRGSGRLLWFPALMPEGEFSLNYIQNMKLDSLYEFHDGERITIVYSQPSIDLFTISLLGGWNLLSLPVIPVDGAIEVLFPSSPSPPYRYKPAERSYEALTAAEGGIGFFLLSTSDTTYQISGVSVDSVRIPVLRGWNLVGTPNSGFGLPLSAMTTEPPDIIIPGNIYYYDPSTRSYLPATSLVPGRGYWLLSRADGVLIIRRSR